MRAIFSTWVLCSAVALESLVGCGPATSSQSQTTPNEDNATFDQLSCAYSPSVGSSALDANLQQSDIQPAHFGKLYNRAWLSGALPASLNEVLRYIPEAGVKLFTADRVSPKSCDNLGSVAKFPSEISSYWTMANQGIGDSAGKGSTLAGLYIPQGTDLNDGSFLKDGPMIVVREDVDRWTVVHEFIHHLFYVEASKSGWDSTAAHDQYQKTVDSAQSLDPSSVHTEADAQNISAQLQTFTTQLQQMTLHYAMEEVAVESLLRDAYEKGNFPNVSELSYENAGWYIQQNAKNALQSFAELRDFIGQFKDVMTQVAPDVESSLEAFVDQTLSANESEIKAIQASIPSSDDSNDTVKPNRKIVGEQIHCEHEQDMEQILKQLHNLNALRAKKVIRS